MATGFKTATVDSGSVGATLTDYPTYVDLSRLGITTQAEADSVRVYAESGKTTEWAREIVSADEMHVLIPSLTSTVEIFVDWDDSASDYAVDATYGAEAVWSDYETVLHMDESSGAAVDSTGRATWADTNTVGAGTGQIEGGRDFTRGNNEMFLTTTEMLEGMSALTVQTWLKQEANTDPQFIWSFNREGNVNDSFSNWALIGDGDATANVQFGIEDTSNKRIIMNTTGTITTGTWTMMHNTWDGSTLRTYLDGSVDATTASTGSFGTFGDTSTNKRIGSSAAGSTRAYDGLQDEFRVRLSYPGANWYATEYDNQSDESTFWGTWSDAGGGGGGFTPTPMMHHLQMAGGLM